MYGIRSVWRPCGNLGFPKPGGAPAAACREPAELLVVSATCLAGTATVGEPDSCYSWLRDREPDAVIGGSLLVFKDVKP